MTIIIYHSNYFSPHSSDSGENKAAALGFLNEIRNRNRKNEKTYDEETDGKIIFKQPSISNSKKNSKHSRGFK